MTVLRADVRYEISLTKFVFHVMRAECGLCAVFNSRENLWLWRWWHGESRTVRSLWAV